MILTLTINRSISGSERPGEVIRREPRPPGVVHATVTALWRLRWETQFVWHHHEHHTLLCRSLLLQHHTATQTQAGHPRGCRHRGGTPEREQHQDQVQEQEELQQRLQAGEGDDPRESDHSSRGLETARREIETDRWQVRTWHQQDGGPEADLHWRHHVGRHHLPPLENCQENLSLVLCNIQ